MRRIKSFRALMPVLSLLLLLVGVPAAPANASVNVSISFFHDSLAPYGRWVYVADYGDVWCPSSVSAGWQPYEDGEWVWTDYGWTWVSYDDWGSIPYHYGTWVFVSDYGWAWLPGTVWAPAWVTWCWSDRYVGWAPVPPSVSISTYGYSGPAVTAAASAYVFVPTASFANTNVSTARVPTATNATLLSETRRVTSFSVASGVVRNPGPPVTEIQRVAGRSIPKASISVAKTDPARLDAAVKGKGRISVVAPASVRSSELGRFRESPKLKPEASAKGVRPAPAATRSGAEMKVAKGHEVSKASRPAPKPVREMKAPVVERAPKRVESAPRHVESTPRHVEERRSAPVLYREPKPEPRHPVVHEPPPERHVSEPRPMPPVERHEAPPPRAQNPPPQVHEAPAPPHPVARPNGPPPAPQGRGGGPPPKREHGQD